MTSSFALHQKQRHKEEKMEQTKGKSFQHESKVPSHIEQKRSMWIVCCEDKDGDEKIIQKRVPFVYPRPTFYERCLSWRSFLYEILCTDSVSRSFLYFIRITVSFWIICLVLIATIKLRRYALGINQGDHQAYIVLPYYEDQDGATRSVTLYAYSLLERLPDRFNSTEISKFNSIRHLRKHKNRVHRWLMANEDTTRLVYYRGKAREWHTMKRALNNDILMVPYFVNTVNPLYLTYARTWKDCLIKSTFFEKRKHGLKKSTRRSKPGFSLINNVTDDKNTFATCSPFNASRLTLPIDACFIPEPAEALNDLFLNRFPAYTIIKLFEDHRQFQNGLLHERPGQICIPEDKDIPEQPYELDTNVVLNELCVIPIRSRNECQHLNKKKEININLETTGTRIR